MLWGSAEVVVVVVPCTVAAALGAATVVGSSIGRSLGRSPPIYLALWPEHSLLTLFCLHLWHGGHPQVHFRLLAVTVGVLLLFFAASGLLLFIFVRICKSTLLLMEILFSEWFLWESISWTWVSNEILHSIVYTRSIVDIWKYTSMDDVVYILRRICRRSL